MGTRKAKTAEERNKKREGRVLQPSDRTDAYEKTACGHTVFLAKDCYFNKMRVIVNFRNRDTLLLF